MKFTTNNNKETQKLGKVLAKELRGGEIICLSGDLGSGKTTFSQGILNGLKIKGPYTSPTFVILKKYKVPGEKIKNAYHIDAYRIKSRDLEELGWKELAKSKENIVILEWAERTKRIIPRNALWIRFKWIDRNKRELAFS